MKKFKLFGISLVFIFALPGITGATVIQYDAGDYVTPDEWGVIASFNPSDGLSHSYYYTWAINDLDPNIDISAGVNIVFHNIRNWRDEDDNLGVFLFDNINYVGNTPDNIPEAQLGWHQYGDDENLSIPNWSQDFSINNVGNWDDPDGDALYDVVFTTNDNNLLGSTQNGDSFVIAIDPDCHYGLDKITVEAPVPEPATMLLLGSGLIGLAGFMRKFRK